MCAATTSTNNPIGNVRGRWSTTRAVGAGDHAAHRSVAADFDHSWLMEPICERRCSDCGSKSASVTVVGRKHADSRDQLPSAFRRALCFLSLLELALRPVAAAAAAVAAATG